MSKFVIECPCCGKYAEASTGIFGIRKIDCSCGYTIDVKNDKVTSRICSHCGNNVIFDQSRGEDAVCPVCHQNINTRESMINLVEFSCPSCFCKLTTDKNARLYVCPLCDTEMDVQQQVEKDGIKNKGLASVIKYEGNNDIFVFKHPIEDFNLGSQLIVHESQEAVFFKDGKALDLFGAGRYTLATQNLPILEELYKLPTNADAVFHSEIYFVNMTTQMGIKWGTDSKVRLFDPSSGLHIEIGACGNFNLKIINSRKLLLKIVGTTNQLGQGELAAVSGCTTAQMVGKFKALIMNKVKSNLARAIKEQNINILEIDEYIDNLSERVRVIINETLEEYGLRMPEFYITSVITPDDDPNFRRLKQQFADKTLKVREEEIRKAEAEMAQERRLVEAQTEAQLKLVGAQGEAESLKIKALAEVEAYKARAYAEAEEMRAKGYTYQQETARQVGLEAMQNGLFGGEGSGGGMGDIAGLGVTLGTIGGVVNMTKEVLNPMMTDYAQIGAGFINTVNNQTSVTAGNAVHNAVSDTEEWTCTCGKQGIISKFCPECGQKKSVAPKGWNCVCGAGNIISKFCPECGAKRPEETTWTCTCGKQGITSKFCPECGKMKGDVQ